MTADADLLSLVFGDDSRGDDAAARAASSRALFVRSQVQVARLSEQATGRRLTAAEALATFGWDALRTVAEDGSFPIITDSGEPATTLKTRREALGMTQAQVARAAGVTAKAVGDAETAGRKSPVRDLEAIAQALALDERVLGYLPRARGDAGLGVRLRELAGHGTANRFSPQVVAKLAEAAWVTARQSSLAASLGEKADGLVSGEAQKDWNYGYPTWQQGFRLASRTRELLELGGRPIPSVRRLLEERLGVPLVQVAVDGRFAGATLANGASRGVVINERGANANVSVRRMTLCHELGHLLWDPDERLNRLMVDDYDGISSNYREAGPDPVEIRANAFAVAFLAPPEETRLIAGEAQTPADAVRAVAERFGISVTAARQHVKNLTQLTTDGVRFQTIPSDDWIIAENLTVDFFPIASTPISRRGQFARTVLLAHGRGLLSSDTVAMMLRCTADEFERHRAALLELTAAGSPPLR